MQKAASAYEAREKICGKASCMACWRAEITAQLQARGPRGREMLPAQAKQENDSDPQREKARKNIWKEVEHRNWISSQLLQQPVRTAQWEIFALS